MASSLRYAVRNEGICYLAILSCDLIWKPERGSIWACARELSRNVIPTNGSNLERDVGLWMLAVLLRPTLPGQSWRVSISMASEETSGTAS